jgi:hypothetical protein
MTIQYIAQAIGFIGMAFVFIAFQCNSKKNILLIQACAGVVFTVHFILLGAYTGAAMNAVEVIRNLIFRKAEKKRIQTLLVVVFVVLFTVIGAMTWQDLFSILPIMAMNLSNIAFSLKASKYIRLCYLPVSTGWLIYNIVTFSIAGIVTETFCLASLLIAFWRYDIAKTVQEKN